jgi:hypothetical protein
MPQIPICASPETRKVYEEHRQLERNTTRPSLPRKTRWNHYVGVGFFVAGFISIPAAVILSAAFMFVWFLLSPVAFGVVATCFFLLPDTAAAKARRHNTKVKEKYSELVERNEIIFAEPRFLELWKQCYEAVELDGDPIVGLERFPEILPLISKAQKLCQRAKRDLEETEIAAAIDSIVETVREEMEIALTKHVIQRDLNAASQLIVRNAEKNDARQRTQAEIDAFRATKSIT